MRIAVLTRGHGGSVLVREVATGRTCWFYPGGRSTMTGAVHDRGRLRGTNKVLNARTVLLHLRATRLGPYPYDKVDVEDLRGLFDPIPLGDVYANRRRIYGFTPLRGLGQLAALFSLGAKNG